MLKIFIQIFGLLLLFSCASSPYDYADFNQAKPKSKPKSILIFPPINDSQEANAPYVYLSLITKPLAEKGYYVFPVAFVDQLMKQNGVPIPYDMHQISLKKINEIINPDTILYLKINEWGQKFNIVSSDTIVNITGTLVNAKNGKVLWQGTKKIVESDKSDSNSFTELLVGAVVSQIVNSVIKQTTKIAEEVNQQLFYDSRRGLPDGPYLLKSKE